MIKSKVDSTVDSAVDSSVKPTVNSAIKSTTKDPLHGKTLKAILEELQSTYGWELLGNEIRINCFHSDPSIHSSLKFLRRTPWARTKVEELFIRHCQGDLPAKDQKLK
jgi:uncharacterized protein (DUF2132 family)